jgi:hypothetical protein
MTERKHIQSLRLIAKELGIKLSTKNGSFELFQYYEDINNWLPIGWKWGALDYGLTAECVEEILSEIDLEEAA